MTCKLTPRDARLLILPGLLAGACSTAAPAQPAPPAQGATAEAAHVAAFTCDDGERPTVRFVGDAAEITDSAGHRWRLARGLAADGFSYVGQGQALRGKGRALTWTSSGKVRQCQAVAMP